MEGQGHHKGRRDETVIHVVTFGQLQTSIMEDQCHIKGRMNETVIHVATFGQPQI
jgi:hypothetical protein